MTTFTLGQLIYVPAIEDVCEAHTATITEVTEEFLCLITEDGEYGELPIELVEELLVDGIDISSPHHPNVEKLSN